MEQQRRHTVTVIVPVFNEERTLNELLRRLVAVAEGAWQIIVVNDGSTDDTAQVLQDWANVPNVEILTHATNRGKGAAFRTGLEHATGDIVAIQDADLEYDPADLPKLIEAFDDDRVQAVYGTRYGPHARLPWTRFRVAVALLNGLVRLLYGVRIHDEASCYKLIRRPLLESLQLRSHRFELCAEITAKLCRLGVTIHELPISYHPRGYGSGKKIGYGAFFRCVRELVRWRFQGLEPAGSYATEPDRAAAVPSGNRLPWGRRNWLRMAVLMGLSGSAVWFSRDYWLPAQSPSDPTGVAKTSEACALRPSVQKIDLGLVQQRTQKNLTFTLTNSGPTEINVSTIRTSCDCLSVEVGARSIQSGDTIEVTLFLDLGKEPNFAGALAIEVEGFQMSGQKLFGLTVLVSVKGEGRAGMPVPVDG